MQVLVRISLAAVVAVTFLACRTPKNGSGVKEQPADRRATEVPTTGAYIKDEFAQYDLNTKQTPDLTGIYDGAADNNQANACYVGDAGSTCEIIEKMFANLHKNFVTGIGENDGELWSCEAGGLGVIYKAIISYGEDSPGPETLSMGPCQ